MFSEGVPSYFRYGEYEPAEDTGAVHCQRIFSRISEQDWEIRPHRHQQLWQLFLVDQGELQAVLESEEVTLIGPAALVVPTTKVHGFGYGEHVRGTMISVSDSFLRDSLSRDGGHLLPYWSEAIHVIDLRERQGDGDFLRQLFDAVTRESAQRRPGFSRALSALLQLLFLELERIDGPRGAYRLANQTSVIFDRFRALVLRHMRSHWSVAEYGRQLGVGERRLNRICRAVCDESPLNYVHRQLIEEAKRCLVHTAMSVTSIGYDLGFEDSAYFSRFFKKHTGVSPSVFAARYRS